MINCRDFLVQYASRSKVDTTIVVTIKSSPLVLLQPGEGMRVKKKDSVGWECGRGWGVARK